MNFELQALNLPACAQHSTDALLWLIDAKPAFGKDALSRLAQAAVADGDLELKAGKVLTIYRPAGLKARRLVIACVGTGQARDIRQTLQAALAALKDAKLHDLTLRFEQGILQAAEGGDNAVAIAVQAVIEANYRYHLTKPKAEPSPLKNVVFAANAVEGLAAPLHYGQAVAHGVNLAREWGNRPANYATPSDLAQAAVELVAAASKGKKGGKPRMECKVLGPKEVDKLGMGAFLAVAQGSRQPLRFIVLQYQGSSAKQAPVVLVGKGISFDTGGISIKPAPEMDEMKFDMCGAASVLGTFQALAQLQPAINVVGLIPSCENMPDGAAVKPGDVVTSMSGQTIEVLNTDAEGRLILCDALHYAKRFKPRAVIDIATLTGACVIALGAVRSGLFSNDEALAGALQRAGDAAQDPCWRMPLDDEYGEGLKSNFADLGNVAGRAAGSVTAAKFLQRFVGELAWAHLDIAGTAWKSGAAKGSTGRPVGLLLRYLVDQAQEMGA